MTTARAKIEKLFTSIGMHMYEIRGVHGFKPEYMATIRKFESAIGGHNNITREIILLEKGEENEKERMALSRAVAESVETDNFIVTFMDTYSNRTVNDHLMEITALTDNVVESTNSLKAICHEYKARNDRLWIGNSIKGEKADIRRKGGIGDWLNGNLVLVPFQVD